MLNENKFNGINIETLVLVAVWDIPFIFQGCFKITALHENSNTLLFFRCQSSHTKQMDILQHDFSPFQYEFTHLYNESNLIQLSTLDKVQEDALYLLKYALHITLAEMLTSRKLHFTSIDNMAMQTMIDKIKPILNKELTLPKEEHLGFAVAMDFCPKEKMGKLAALSLIRELKKQDANIKQCH